MVFACCSREYVSCIGQALVCLIVAVRLAWVSHGVVELDTHIRGGWRILQVATGDVFSLARCMP
jgi:hypothetical protein